jgi:hypothetical protein
MNERDYLRLLTRHAEQANDLLSNARKWERERWACQRLLLALNLPYRLDEFRSGQEPPDVQFREANFEVFFVLDEGRRLNEEWREEVNRRRNAFSLSQLVRRERRPQRISASQLQARLAPTLRKKAHNYRERGIDPGELDLLAFVNLKRVNTGLQQPIPTAYGISAPGLALPVPGGPDLRTGTVRARRCAGVSAQQPGKNHAV